MNCTTPADAETLDITMIWEMPSGCHSPYLYFFKHQDSPHCSYKARTLESKFKIQWIFISFVPYNFAKAQLSNLSLTLHLENCNHMIDWNLPTWNKTQCLPMYNDYAPVSCLYFDPKKAAHTLACKTKPAIALWLIIHTFTLWYPQGFCSHNPHGCRKPWIVDSAGGGHCPSHLPKRPEQVTQKLHEFQQAALPFPAWWMANWAQGFAS